MASRLEAEEKGEARAEGNDTQRAETSSKRKKKKIDSAEKNNGGVRKNLY